MSKIPLIKDHCWKDLKINPKLKKEGYNPIKICINCGLNKETDRQNYKVSYFAASARLGVDPTDCFLNPAFEEHRKKCWHTPIISGYKGDDTEVQKEDLSGPKSMNNE